MPLDEDYGPQIYSSNADLCNVGHLPSYQRWLHLASFFLDWRETSRFMHCRAVPQSVRRWYRGKGWTWTLRPLGSHRYCRDYGGEANSLMMVKRRTHYSQSVLPCSISTTSSDGWSLHCSSRVRYHTSRRAWLVVLSGKWLMIQIYI